MNAADVMTKPALTLPEDAGLLDALRLMTTRNISGVPIVGDDKTLVGILTEGDLLRRAEVGTGERHWSGLWSFVRGPGLGAAEYVRAHSRRVADLMSRDPVAASEATSLQDIVALMEHHHIRRVPILRDRRVVGIVSRADLLRAVCKALAGSPVPRLDSELLTRLRDELARQPWFTERNIKLSVHDGVVRMQGVVTDERMRDALRVAAQNISGRTEVDDELEVLEPITGTVIR
ncbi:MAG: CBS domain-containing protein [Acetobacteraceae bacterium]|nr:CBS domain-containing protein [Acetobacteraceae bacterium]